MLGFDYPLMQYHVPEEQSPQKWQDKGNVMVIQLNSNCDIRKFFFLRCQNNLAPKFSLKMKKSVTLCPPLEDFPPTKHENVTTQKMFHPFGLFWHPDFRKVFDSCNVFPMYSDQIMLSVC